MPNYDYKCTECGYSFEIFQQMSAERIKVCPQCGGKVKRLIVTGSGPIFKGSGFYQTDYKNKPKISPEKKDGESGKSEKKKPTEKESKKE